MLTELQSSMGGEVLMGLAQAAGANRAVRGSGGGLPVAGYSRGAETVSMVRGWCRWFSLDWFWPCCYTVAC